MKPGRINILFLISYICIAGQGQALLDRYIPIPPQELSVEQFLYHIEDITGYHPAYSSAIVENKRLAIWSDSLKVRELLDTLFSNVELQYIVRNDQLILSPQSKSLFEQNQIKLTGIVLNNKNSKPIPYANIFVPYKSMGTISNFEGRFELVVPIDPKIDSLVVSCMGYSEESVMSLDFLRGPVEVRLNPYRFQIDELIVRPTDPMQLLRGMIANKEDNYPNKPEMLTAFFREVAQQDDKYISLSEALVDIYKTSYSNEDNDLIRLRKGRRGSNTEAAEVVNFIVEGGLYNNLQLDIIKYTVNFLDPEYFRNYEYNYVRQINYNSRQTYIISFLFKRNLDIIGFTGKLYIDVASLALVRAEFAFDEESLRYAQSLLVRKVPKSYRIRPKYGKYEVEYRMYGGKWNLSHARSEVALKLRKKKDRKETGFSSQFLASSEFVVTGKTVGDIQKIAYRDASKPRDVLYEQVANTDAAFWGNETVILPEEPLSETIKKLKIEQIKTDQSYVSSSGKDE